MTSSRICCIASLLLSAATAHAVPLFIRPLEGVPYVDWTIVNYVDLDGTAGIQDYRFGVYTYDGHMGTDFTLANFAAMDGGVAVYAARTGTVIEVHDGEFDRNTTQTNAPANYVKIDHGGNLETWYWHLRKNSIVVTTGRQVVAGQKIAEVGSSGSSTDAHLHFEVRNNGFAVDPFLSNLWYDPPPYAGDVPGVLDAGIDDRFPTAAERKERATNDVIIGLDNTNFVHWVQVHGLSPSNTMRWDVYAPHGAAYRDWEYSPTSTVSYGWYYAGWTRPTSLLQSNKPWRSVFKIDGVICSELEFYVGKDGDTDGDGIDDYLEVPPLLVGQDDRITDSDDDGMANADELLADTDPDSPDSFLGLDGISQDSNGSAVVSFKQAAGRFYAVESRTSLGTGTWTRDHVIPGIMTGATRNIAIDSAGASTKFYRLKLIVKP